MSKKSIPVWGEEFAYNSKVLFQIKDNRLPPVNYSTHSINSHSVTHAEGSLHTQQNGLSIDQYFCSKNYFIGKALVMKLPGNKYKKIPSDSSQIYLWEVTVEEIKEQLVKQNYPQDQLSKLLLTTEFCPQTEEGIHDPNYVLILSKAAATFLHELPNFNLYGTSWKSSDYAANSNERPIHNILFSKAIIFELLNLSNVPAGEYFFVGVPLNIDGASESPVNPVLINKDEFFSILDWRESKS